MKKLLLWVMLPLCLLQAKAQTITGKVYREGTDTVIAGASVYYSGSMGGTITDKAGHFELQAKQQQIPLIVSCIGYYSATSPYTPGKSMVIYLKPKLEELHTVTIRADGMDRKEEIKRFTEAFLGTSDFAKSCTITNMDDINFSYSKKTEVLTASCDKPIIIQNKKLGYTVSYYLDKFTNKGKEVFIAGNYTFKEIPELAGQPKIIRNREDAYEGSRMQFIRALWYHQLEKAGFVMYTGRYIPVTENNIVAHDSLQNKYIHLPDDPITITHSNDARVLNHITTKQNLIFIDKDGFYGAGLNWTGQFFGNERIGDLLPFEYKSPQEAKYMVADAPAKPVLATAKPTVKGGEPTIQSDKQAAANAIAMPVMPELPAKPKLVFEKTYLHTDRAVYAQGDTLWFKAYLVNAQDNTPIASSGNLHVELISPGAKIITSELIRMDKGLGNGDFDLPDSLAAGKYHLRAYTNWMRNFGDNFVFEKEITILNTAGVAAAVAVAPKGQTKKSATTNTATAAKHTATALPLVRFYPEGGSLVEGLSSFVAVKADDGFGNGIPALGSVVSSSGDTVAHFSCDTLGMGMFALIPVKGQSYHAVVDLAKRKAQVFELPSALSKGLTLQVRQTDSLIRMVVSSSSDPALLAVKPTYTISVKHGGLPVISKNLQPTAQQTVVRLPTAGLPEGINAITLYDENHKPNCERLVYIHHPGSNPITITTDKKSYQPKEKVTAHISAPPNTNLSMAVVDSGLSPMPTEDIVSYLMLQSEIRGNIENASRYFDTTNLNRARQLDLLLMTQGWRDFVWRRLADTAIRISYAAEDGVPVSGNVRDEVNEKRMPGLNLNLYANGAKGDKIFAAKTDSAGKFNFTGIMMYGKQNVKLSAVNNKGEKRGSFQVDSVIAMPVKPNIVKIASKEIEQDSLLAAIIEKRSDNIKKANITGVTKLKEVTIKGKGQAVLLRNGGAMATWGPDQSFRITPKDYEFKTLLWFLLQNTKGAQNAVDDQRYIRETQETRPLTGVVYPGYDIISYTVTNLGVSSSTRYKAISTQVPVILIVNNQELLMDDYINDYDQAEIYRHIYFEMPINKFKSIVLKHVTGTLHGIGVRPQAENIMVDRYLLYLNLIDDAAIDNPGSLSTDVDGYYQARTFYQPPPNAKLSMADFRSTIHWEPFIKTDALGKATVSFYNGSAATSVKVFVQGITDKGVPISVECGYSPL
jgi:hypothetical protein